jgi:hypothetical protein
VELLVVIVIGGLLLIQVLPRLAGNKQRSPRIACVNRLNQIGIAFRTYTVDYQGAYPWLEAKTAVNGTKVFKPKVPFTNQVSSDLLGLFLSVSNELSTPKILVCPTDLRPGLATDRWDYVAAHPRSSHRNLSYFVGLGSTEYKPESILAGDRNVTNAAPWSLNGSDVVETTPAWVPDRDPKAFRSLGFDARTMHRSAGNILLGDGSVQQVSNGRLRDAMEASSMVSETAWLFPVDH